MVFVRVKVVVFRESGCIQADIVKSRKKWLYSGKDGYIREKVDVLVVVIVQSGCNLENVVVF